jgi:ATP synthase protein I
MVEDQHDKLRRSVERRVRREEKAERDRPTLLAQTTYLGTLGLVFVLPVIAGAYLGRWLDELTPKGFSIHWTMTCIFIGLFVGALNVYLLMRGGG